MINNGFLAGSVLKAAQASARHNKQKRERQEPQQGPIPGHTSGALSSTRVPTSVTHGASLRAGLAQNMDNNEMKIIIKSNNKTRPQEAKQTPARIRAKHQTELFSKHNLLRAALASKKRREAGQMRRERRQQIQCIEGISAHPNICARGTAHSKYIIRAVMPRTPPGGPVFRETTLARLDKSGGAMFLGRFRRRSGPFPVYGSTRTRTRDLAQAVPVPLNTRTYSTTSP